MSFKKDNNKMQANELSFRFQDQEVHSILLVDTN